ncbi:Uncharacterized protein PBTT_10061 [Plasmodiophora brassicae]
MRRDGTASASSALAALMERVRRRLVDSCRPEVLRSGDWDPASPTGRQLHQAVVDAMLTFFYDDIRANRDLPNAKRMASSTPGAPPESKRARPADDAGERVSVVIVLTAEGFSGQGLQPLRWPRSQPLSPQVACEYVKSVCTLPVESLTSHHLNLYDEAVGLFCQWTEPIALDRMERLADGRFLLRVKVIGLDLTSSHDGAVVSRPGSHSPAPHPAT